MKFAVHFEVRFVAGEFILVGLIRIQFIQDLREMEGHISLKAKNLRTFHFLYPRTACRRRKRGGLETVTLRVLRRPAAGCRRGGDTNRRNEAERASDCPRRRKARPGRPV